MSRVVIWLFSLFLISCATVSPDVRCVPHYNRVDEQIGKYLSRFLELAKNKNLVFSKTIYADFEKIEEPWVVGYCYGGHFWREIQVDPDYWERASEVQKAILVFHEAAHCYCGRDHDYGNGTAYPSDLRVRIEEFLEWTKKGGPKPGRYSDDSCPTSLMYPEIIDTDCYFRHYSEYMEEIFNRCHPF